MARYGFVGCGYALDGHRQVEDAKIVAFLIEMLDQNINVASVPTKSIFAIAGTVQDFDSSPIKS